MLESRKFSYADKYDESIVTAWDREKYEKAAEIAFVFIEKWGMVAGIPDGEDSAGRQKVRLGTPQEIVDRAFECALLAVQRAHDEGLVHIAPSMNEENNHEND